MTINETKLLRQLALNKPPTSLFAIHIYVIFLGLELLLLFTVSFTEKNPHIFSSLLLQKEYCYIQSNLNPQLVLTIGGLKHGEDLVMYPAYGGPNQLWRLDDPFLVSKIGLVADGKKLEKGSQCCGWFNHGGDNQKWTYNEDTCEIVSMGNCQLVMDIKGGEDKTTAPVILWEKHGGANQKWKKVTPDQMHNN